MLSKSVEITHDFEIKPSTVVISDVWY
jgi:hypothetical protein